MAKNKYIVTIREKREDEFASELDFPGLCWTNANSLIDFALNAGYEVIINRDDND